MISQHSPLPSLDCLNPAPTPATSAPVATVTHASVVNELKASAVSTSMGTAKAGAGVVAEWAQAVERMRKKKQTEGVRDRFS